MPDVGGRLRHAADTKLLWDVCQVPDFRKVTLAEHASLCVRIFRFLHEGRGIPTDWLARADRADRPHRRRHRHAVEAIGVYPHMDLRRPASGVDRRRRPLA